MNSLSNKTKLVIFSVSAVLFLCGYLTSQSTHDAKNSIFVPDPLHAQTYFQIAQFYFNHGDEREGEYDLIKAREYYGLAVAENPKLDNELWYQFGRVDFIEGKFDEALEKFEKQIEYFGDEIPNVYYMIGLTYGYKGRVSGNVEDWRSGEEAFETFIHYAPLAPWSRVDLAWIYFSQGKYEEMKPILEEGLLYRPNNAWLLNMYGLALLNTGKEEDALTEFLKAKKQADILTQEDWGRSYPGNDPELWGRGLSEFRELITKNITLAEKSSAQ